MYHGVSILAYQALIGLTLVAHPVYAIPHDQMADNEFMRDVGVIYSNTNFTGEALYLVTHKKAAKCETISGPALGSVQICVPSTCVFYKSKDCTLSEVGNDHFFKGPVDVDNLQAVPDMACDSYMCGPVEDMAHVIGDVAPASASVNSEGGYWGVVGGW